MKCQANRTASNRRAEFESDMTDTKVSVSRAAQIVRFHVLVGQNWATKATRSRSVLGTKSQSLIHCKPLVENAHDMRNQVPGHDMHARESAREREYSENSILTFPPHHLWLGSKSGRAGTELQVLKKTETVNSRSKQEVSNLRQRFPFRNGKETVSKRLSAHSCFTDGMKILHARRRVGPNDLKIFARKGPNWFRNGFWVLSRNDGMSGEIKEANTGRPVTAWHESTKHVHRNLQ